MQYDYQSKVITDNTTMFQLYANGKALTNADVYRLWVEDEKFTRFYVQCLIDTGYSGFCWETPSITTNSLKENHEFVVVKSSTHSHISQDWTPFAEYFLDQEFASSFLNLGKDGTMISPTPDKSFDGGSIASFLKTASDNRIIALWALIGKEVVSKVSDVPIWLSTAGLGVSWLHIRLDSKPKYYRYLPYKQSS